MTFDSGDWDERQWVYVLAVDDLRSEGDRLVVIQHSTISSNPAFDAVAVRNVEVSVRDNDTPGVYVTAVTPGTTNEDKRTVTIEGACFDPAVDKVPHDEPIGGHADQYTGLNDELLVQLQKDPGLANVRVKLVLDAESQQAIQLDSTDSRWHKWTYDAGDTSNPALWFTYYTIDFDSTNWDDPVVVKVSARPDGRPEDPQTAVIEFLRDDSDAFQIFMNADGTVNYAKSEIDGGKTSDPFQHYVFPNIRSGSGLTSVEVIDDDTPDVVSIESGTGTIVTKCGNTFCTTPGQTDDYTIRLTKQPEELDDDDHSTDPVHVDVAVLTDGLADVTEINGVPLTPAGYSKIGGLVASRLFKGNLSVSADGLTLKRANGSDLGSFEDEGFKPGDYIRVAIIGIGSADVYISAASGSVSDKELKLSTAIPFVFRSHTTTDETDTVSFLTRDGVWTGAVSFAHPAGQGWQVVRSDSSSWLGDGFLEGQWVEVCISNAAGTCTGTTGRYKIAIIRGDNETKDEKLEFRHRADDDNPYTFEDDLSTFGPVRQ